MSTLMDPPAVTAGSAAHPAPEARPTHTAGNVRTLGTDPLTWATAISVFTLGLWAITGGRSDLLAGGSAAVLSVSRLAGLVAALSALFGMVLTARPRWLERSAGLDRLIGWHRWTGMGAAFGMAIHVAAALFAAAGGFTGLWSALVDLTGADWYFAAVVAAILFAVVSLTSWRRIRRRMSYETWHVVHLVGYLAIVLGFGHQLVSGTTISQSLATQLWWTSLYVIAFGIVAVSRMGGLVRSIVRPRTSLARVVAEAPGVASLVITGPGVDSLRAQPGQFVCLRVLNAALWWQAHPYSLSAAPRSGALRLNVKALGDGSALTLAARPGTRVLLEGPYGRMSIARAQERPVLLIGAGVGLAPIRALLEAASPEQTPMVLARAHSDADLPLAGELADLARERGGSMTPITGPRTQFPEGNPFTAKALAHNIPDLRQRAVFVCGPVALQEQVCAELERAGVPREQIHSERFAW